jgi:hypothetical protein
LVYRRFHAYTVSLEHALMYDEPWKSSSASQRSYDVPT